MAESLQTKCLLTVWESLSSQEKRNIIPDLLLNCDTLTKFHFFNQIGCEKSQWSFDDRYIKLLVCEVCQKEWFYLDYKYNRKSQVFVRDAIYGGHCESPRLGFRNTDECPAGKIIKTCEECKWAEWDTLFKNKVIPKHLLLCETHAALNRKELMEFLF